MGMLYAWVCCGQPGCGVLLNKAREGGVACLTQSSLPHRPKTMSMQFVALDFIVVVMAAYRCQSYHWYTVMC
jgi:hypothetical protein